MNNERTQAIKDLNEMLKYKQDVVFNLRMEDSQPERQATLNNEICALTYASTFLRETRDMAKNYPKYYADGESASGKEYNNHSTTLYLAEVAKEKSDRIECIEEEIPVIKARITALEDELAKIIVDKKLVVKVINLLVEEK